MKKLPAKPGELKTPNSQTFGRRRVGTLSALVRAARKQCHQHHQVRQRKKPLIRLNSRRFRRSRDEPKVPALGEVVQVVDANPREVGHFVISENLLARFDGNHDVGPRFSPPTGPYTLDAKSHTTAAYM
jgi:hypothetical protein